MTPRDEAILKLRCDASLRRYCLESGARLPPPPAPVVPPISYVEYDTCATCWSAIPRDHAGWWARWRHRSKWGHDPDYSPPSSLNAADYASLPPDPYFRRRSTRAARSGRYVTGDVEATDPNRRDLGDMRGG